MKLNGHEQAMLAGEEGAPRRLAMEHLIEVGTFFDAEDFVEVAQVHLMADSESLGPASIEFLEWLADHPVEQRRVRVPTVTDPRGADFKAYKRIRQDQRFVDQERRMVGAFRALDILLTDTCINYQTIMPPVRGEHLAFGDTGSTIYANSVLGARSNFEGGPSALSAALTGRVPRYGFHLDRCRRGSARFVLTQRPRTLSDWGAAGAIVGRHMRSYFDVPVIEGVRLPPTSDELKHFGAALASFGSTPLFHMIGVTPEAPDLQSVFEQTPPEPTVVGQSDLQAFYQSYGGTGDPLDVVVFAAPQLSLFEMQRLGALLDGKQINPKTALLVATSPEIKAAADRHGITEQIERAGGIVLEGVCFYQMHAREIGEANGWRRLMSNSAKLINIIRGYGYQPTLAPMDQCVASAVAGKVL